MSLHISAGSPGPLLLSNAISTIIPYAGSNISGIHLKNICILVSSADNLASSLDPDQAQQNVGPDLDPNCLIL